VGDRYFGLDEVNFETRIGTGSTGTTFKASLRGVTVAVKVVHSLSVWRTEVTALTRLRHEHIVAFHGVVHSPPTYCLILEYCDMDLRRALEQPTPPGFWATVSGSIAKGMAYLHSEEVLHRDLKSKNVLLTEGGGVRITDFGLASTRFLPQRSNSCGGGASVGSRMTRSSSLNEMRAEVIGTPRWMAPEVARREGFTKSADVFSFGMVLFELTTHEIPFAPYDSAQAAALITLDEARPPLPEGLPDPLQALVSRCWCAEPSQRPSFDEIVAELSAAVGGLSRHDGVWLDEPAGHPVYCPEDFLARSCHGIREREESS